MLDLSLLDAATGHKLLVTGYDFLLDTAKQVRLRFKKVLGQCTTNPSPPPQDLCSADDDLEPVDGSLVSATWNLSDATQRAQALQDALCGHGGDPYAIASLSGHATHYEEGVPGESAYTIEGLATQDMTSADACGASQALSLPGAVVYAMGCHGGLPVPGSDPTDAENSLDLPQTPRPRRGDLRREHRLRLGRCFFAPACGHRSNVEK